ncbi:hypothetical protein QEH56_03420 [Pelagicoccus enzymogenes]|uniref:hypothetical protein n=1 Tax=Pelagicoccus enzymogenes TaxID=2773457 RepID=UPI0028100FD4|nr:hypothetical protein [Pelagicoccus enzymogenes]MDQ8197178.1 hypothetical protein [Pelagicoccus enzymogenes]
MPDSRGKYTLEELMRAKRKEQPGPEFWVRFDREFKQKQKLLIQRQLVSETGLKSLFSTRIYKVGAFTATFGVAAVAVYLGFQAPVNETTVAQSQAPAAQPAPSFAVATNAEPARAETPAKTSGGLQEFATLAQPSAPRVVIQSPATSIAKKPSPSQINVLKTLASLEDTIRAKRASDPAPTPSYQFVSSNGLFETELSELEEASVDGVWDFEDAYLLGKYADPLTGTLNTNRSVSIDEIQHVSFSQLDEALSSQGSRRSRSIDALTVKF